MNLIKELGAGGFGVVELVSDEEGKMFARKTFSPSQKMSPELTENVRKRFIREARAQQGFSHRNIVPVLGSNMDGENPYYLMPVAISSLSDDLKADRTLGGNFISAISDIVSGLSEIHALEIYHRDLKPQNILRLQNGNEYAYAVSDFGLISQKDSTLSKLTTTGMAKGSDYFTAPEITADLKKATIQSDIYSLGCILHEMVGTTDRVPCQEIREEGDYAQILLGCTRNDPSRRFKSAQAVLDALISIDPSAPALQTDQAKKFVDALDNSKPITADDWSKFVEFVEDNKKSDDAKALLLRLNLERIEEICTTHPELANRLGIAFSEWVAETSFNFDTCDVIANRINLFFKHCSIGPKIECLMALLIMGTSHNRWYVERMFTNSCSKEMEETLAKRLAIEFRTSQDRVCRAISHLEYSINVTRDEFHPLLVSTLKDIC